MFHKVRNYESILFLNGDFMYSFVGLTGKTYTMYMKRISNAFTFFLKMFQLLRVYVLCVGDDIMDCTTNGAELNGTNKVSQQWVAV